MADEEIKNPFGTSYDYLSKWLARSLEEIIRCTDVAAARDFATRVVTYSYQQGIRQIDLDARIMAAESDAERYKRWWHDQVKVAEAAARDLDDVVRACLFMHAEGAGHLDGSKEAEESTIRGMDALSSELAKCRKVIANLKSMGQASEEELRSLRSELARSRSECAQLRAQLESRQSASPVSGGSRYGETVGGK